MKSTCLTLKNNVDYIGFGIEINGEINYLDVNFIRNPYTYGLLVTDPDGNSYSKFVSYKIIYCDVKFKFEGLDITVALYNDKDSYILEVIQ